MPGFTAIAAASKALEQLLDRSLAAAFPARSLAQHYSATGLEQELAAAHLELDRQVDALFGVGTNPAEGERQQSLFEAYLSLVPSPSLLD